MAISELLANASLFSAILPLSAALYNYRQLQYVLKLAASFFLVSAVFDLALMLTRNIGNNMPILHSFIIVSVLFYTAIYYQAFSKKVLKTVLVVLSSAALLVFLLNAFFIEGIRAYPSLSNTVLSLLLIIISLLYFYQLLNRQEFMQIEKQGMFWINSGVLMYSGINIFLFMLLSRMSPQDTATYYSLHSVTNVIANLLFAIGLLCKPQKTT